MISNRSSGGGGASVVDAVGDRLAQVAGEDRPYWRSLTWIRLTRALERVEAVLATVFAGSRTSNTERPVFCSRAAEGGGTLNPGNRSRPCIAPELIEASP